jgi:hypothetical protein
MLVSAAFARPFWPSVPPLGIRVDVSRGARARVHTFSFDGAARDSLHVIEWLTARVDGNWIPVIGVDALVGKASPDTAESHSASARRKASRRSHRG